MTKKIGKNKMRNLLKWYHAVSACSVHCSWCMAMFARCADTARMHWQNGVFTKMGEEKENQMPLPTSSDSGRQSKKKKDIVSLASSIACGTCSIVDQLGMNGWLPLVSQLQSRSTELRMVAIVLNDCVCQLTPQQKGETVFLIKYVVNWFLSLANWDWKVNTSLPWERSFPDQYWYWLTRASNIRPLSMTGTVRHEW